MDGAEIAVDGTLGQFTLPGDTIMAGAEIAADGIVVDGIVAGAGKNKQGRFSKKTYFFFGMCEPKKKK